MAVLSEGRHPGEFILSEATKSRSRESVTVVAGSGVIAPGAVLGRFTSGANAGKYSLAPNAAADPDVGNQAAVAVAIYGCDATSADKKIAILARDAEVNGNMLSYGSTVDDAPKKAAKNLQLGAAGIIVR